MHAYILHYSLLDVVQGLNLARASFIDLLQVNDDYTVSQEPGHISFSLCLCSFYALQRYTFQVPGTPFVHSVLGVWC